VDAVLSATDLWKRYPVRGGGGQVTALAGVTLDVSKGETLGVVGESGCGKSTLARLLLRLEEPSSGRVELDGIDLASLSGHQLRAMRRRIQMVLQDPYASLNPRLTVAETLIEVVRVHHLADGRQAEKQRVAALLDQVGLGPTYGGRYPHELSGGQRQRVGIARALAVEPQVLVLDEPVSALDVSVRAEIMNLLVRLRSTLDLTYVFISHDIAMVRHVSDRIAVMYLGRVVELGPWRLVLDQPLHPYTSALGEAIPVPDPGPLGASTHAPLGGEVPNPADPPAGCPFHPRCPLTEDICRAVRPELLELRPGQRAACHVAARQHLASTPA
jgi:oligopeptide/dipeptide ABC transporter ATP-binding protein